MKMRKECKKGANQKCKSCGFKNGSLKKMPKMPTTISFANHTKLEADFRKIREADELFSEVSPIICINILDKLQLIHKILSFLYVNIFLLLIQKGSPQGIGEQGHERYD